MPRKLTATTGVVLALALAGCGGDDSSKTTSQGAAATTPVATTPATTTSAAKASKKTTTTSKKTDAATSSGSKAKGIGTDSSGETKAATKKKKKAATTTKTTTSKKPVGVTPATGSGSGSEDPTSGGGSGPSEDRVAVLSVLRRYYKAFIESDGADACAQLTKEGQDLMVRNGGAKTCAESVVNLVKRAGADNVNRLSSTRDGLHVDDITVTGNNATAKIGPVSRLRLVQISGRWYLRSPNVVNNG